MSGEAKEIKFKFVVDEQSAQRVNRVLDEMIKRAQELAKTLQGLGGVPGGGGGGLMGGGSVGGRPPSAQSTMAQAGGAQTQKVSFASVLNTQVEGLRKVATEGNNAMKLFGDSLTRGVNQQQRDIGKLQQALDRLQQSYERLKGTKAGDQIQAKMGQIRGTIGEETLLSRVRGMRAPGQPELMPEVPWPDQGGAKAGLFSRFRGFLNQGGGIGGQDISMQNISKVPGFGFMQGMSGGGGMMFAAAGLAATLGVKAAMSQANAAWNNQVISQTTRAEFGTAGPSSYARKIRGGDLSDIRAMQDIMQDADKRREYMEIQDPGWIRRQGNRMGAFKDAFSERGFKEAFSELFAGTEGYNYQKNLRAQQRATLDRNIEERGVQEDIFRDATAGALGKMGTMRALGIGGGYKKTGAYVSASEKFLNAYAQFDPSEVIGAVQGIAGQGTRKAAYSDGLLNTVLQAQAAGITGAANIGGIYSRAGEGAGTEMIDLLRSVAGRGTDVSTAGLLGNYLAGVQGAGLQGNLAGAGALGALAYGTQGADGNLIARQNIAGMGAFGNLLAGSRDPAQSAINFAIARRSAPDAGYYAQQYLATGLTAERMADLQGGKFTPNAYERNLGITEEMLQKQVAGVQQSQAFRVMSKGFGKGNMVGDFAKELAGGASMREAARKVFGDDEQAQIEGVASYLKAGNIGDYKDMGAAMGAARVQLFGLGKTATKGKMVGDVAGGSIEAKQAREEAQVRETDRQLKDASIKAIEAQVQGQADAYKRLVTNSTNLAITADNITEIIKTFAKNLKAASGGAVPPATNVKAAPK